MHAAPLWIALSAAALVTACGRHPHPPSAESLPTVQVTVGPVAPSRHTAQEEVLGTVRPLLRAAIEAKVSGRIARMHAGIGQRVAAGELLVELDADEVRAKLDQAIALRTQAEQDLRRYETLLAQQAVTQAEYDAVQARSRVARAAVQEAETVLNYARVTAPFAGVIAIKLVDVGDLATPGRALLEIEDNSRFQFEVNIPETLLIHLDPKRSYAVRIPGQDAPLMATLAERAPAADPNSRTFRVKFDLPSEPGLLAGQFGRVSIPTGETAALRAPAGALLMRGQLELVFVVAEGKAHLRLVRTGKRLGDDIELITGVEAGEQVVVNPPADLTDGQPVTLAP